MSKVQPEYDHDNQTHWFIWHCMSYDLKDEDFQAIQKALLEREDTLDQIKRSDVMYVPFDDNMMQPREVPPYMKDQARRYADWSCAFDICMILSKYAKFFSKFD